MVALAVAAVLVTVAVPAYQGLVQGSLMTAAVNSLSADLHFARSEAVTRGYTVIVCKSSDGASCAENGGWDQGWIVYASEPGSAATDLLRVHSALDGRIDIAGNAHVEDRIEFGANGFAYGYNGTLTVSAQSRAGVVEIVISNTGRIRTEHCPAGGCS